MPEIRLRRQVRLVFRKAGERSHASAAFLQLVEDKKKHDHDSPRHRGTEPQPA
jgi:hypothetical protein